MAKQTVLTSEGLKKLEEELDELKSVKRREVAEKIKIALGYGDLSENSEYDEAKNEQKCQYSLCQVHSVFSFFIFIYIDIDFPFPYNDTGG